MKIWVEIYTENWNRTVFYDNPVYVGIKKITQTNIPIRQRGKYLQIYDGGKYPDDIRFSLIEGLLIEPGESEIEQRMAEKILSEWRAK